MSYCVSAIRGGSSAAGGSYCVPPPSLALLKGICVDLVEGSLQSCTGGTLSLGASELHLRCVAFRVAALGRNQQFFGSRRLSVLSDW